jgi:hypothetical protein
MGFIKNLFALEPKLIKLIPIPLLFRVGPGQVFDIADEQPRKGGFFCLKLTFLALKSPF